jgi:hypothetical protein
MSTNQPTNQPTMATPSTLPLVQSYPLDMPSDPAGRAQFDEEVAHLFRRITGRFPKGYLPPAKAAKAAKAAKPQKRKRETL